MLSAGGGRGTRRREGLEEGDVGRVESQTLYFVFSRGLYYYTDTLQMKQGKRATEDARRWISLLTRFTHRPGAHLKCVYECVKAVDPSREI